MVLQGPDKGRRFELPDEPALVGRESRQLPLTDNTVSRRHAELLPDNGSWILKDLGSSNGSYVNGARVTARYTLKLGDQIRVGRTLMVFGAQPGVSRTSGGNVSLTGAEAGMDSAIVAAAAATAAAATAGAGANGTVAGEKPAPEKIHASRTIINHVLQSGEGVLSSNAMADQRFSKGKSVHNLGIRSALCVPIKARRLGGKAEDKEGLEEIIGVVYVDSSVKNYTYSP